MSHPVPTSTSPSGAMSHSAVMQALSGLLMGMFVSILAGTVVSTSLPRIISELHGSQTSYTWVVTATLLATTVSTPIWGKLADLTNRKMLIQIALIIFVVGSALAGFSQDTGTLIFFRVLQGLGGGGLGALSQIVMADIISPRDRGRYMGLFGAVMAVGTVGGPLLGGVITDAWGWRWNFFVALPFAIAAILLLQRNLHLPKLIRNTKVKIDYIGATLVTGGVSLLLIWVSLAGKNFEWNSAASWIMVVAAVLMLIAFVFVELRVSEPIIPMSLFRNRTYTLSVIASISVGIAMFGTSVFLGQYMQLARGATPTQAGLLTIPMIAGLLIASMVSGMLISKFGKWKPYMVVGSILLTVGLILMGTIHYDTNYVLVSVFMFVLGMGVGMVMQNLVLVVQNAVAQQELGVASSGVNFFRSLGGTIGVSVLGSVLATKVADGLTEQKAELGKILAGLGEKGAEIAKNMASGTLPEVSAMPAPVRVIFEGVYGDSIASLFTLAVPLAIVTVIAVIFLPNASLSNKTARQRLAEEAAEDTTSPATETLIAVSEATVAGSGGTLNTNTGAITIQTSTAGREAENSGAPKDEVDGPTEKPGH